MNDRRENSYTFASEKMLVEFFSRTLTQDEITAIFGSIRSNFIKRPSQSAREHTLQFLKKCETELIRRVHQDAEKKE
jgi:hypothetical protein